VPLLQGIGTVSGALAGLYIVFKKHTQRFIIFPVQILISYLKSNFTLFISSLSSQIYVNANKLIVGSFLGMKEIAVYDIADKIVNLLKVPISLLGQTLFPRVSREKNVKFLKKVMLFVFILYAVIYTFIYVFAVPIIYLFTGAENKEAASLLRLLALSILPSSIALFLAELLLIPFNFLKDYTKMRASSMIGYLIMIFFIWYFNSINVFKMAGIIIIVEVFVLAYSYFLCKKNKIL
jgi:PST family polysaccharide transporter